jgi:hypothetical protein
MVPCVAVTGTAGVSGELEAADSAAVPAWARVDAFLLTNTPHYYFDMAEPLLGARFFRARQTAFPPTVLAAGVVPALTLTGSPPSRVRIDAIDQFGPIDAWYTLATVTLTNTSQVYFDVAAWGQPPRCYRLVPVP